MTKPSQKPSWLKALAEVAREQNVAWPRFTGHAMGGARTAPDPGGRFVTFKCRLVPEAQAAIDGVEWALWYEHEDLPYRVAAFREPLEPKLENVRAAFALLKGWLVDGWTPAEANAAVKTHPQAQPVAGLASLADVTEDAGVR